MKALEVFSPKAIRSCARVLDLLAQRGLDLSDLHSHAEHMRFMAGKGGSLVFKGVEFTERPEGVLEGLGWRTLRTWLKIKKIVDKAGINLEDLRTFTQQSRKKELNSDHYGRQVP